MSSDIFGGGSSWTQRYEPDVPGSVVHVAGNVFITKGLLFQRCLVCGTLLCYADDVDKPANRGRATTIVHWAPNAMIREHEGKYEFVGQFDPNRVPDNLCDCLVEK